MGFSEEQKRFVISELESLGWEYDDDVICAPSEGIFLGAPHFQRSPQEMHETIGSRGTRVARERHDDWERFSEEHFQICRAIEKMWEAGL